MSIYLNLTWPVIDVAAVCALQSLGSAGSLTLNGTLVNPDLSNQISFIALNMIRSVSITSANNLSGINFTVSGFQNGAYLTEVITGPNNDTVFGTNYYDQIISVVASGAVTNVSIGTGKAGFLPLISVNTVSNNINYSCSVTLTSGSPISWNIQQTLVQINTNFIPFYNQIGTNLFPLYNTSQTTSQLVNFTAITNFLLLEVVGTSFPTTGILKFIYLQE